MINYQRPPRSPPADMPSPPWTSSRQCQAMAVSRAPACISAPFPHAWARRSRCLVAAGASIMAGGCQEGILNPAGPVARAEALLLADATVVMLAVIVPLMILTLVFAWWFRAGNARARYRPEWSYSGRIELTVWSIPALIIMFLGGMGWVSSHQLHPARPLSSPLAPVEIEVVSLDWKWLFIYPQENLATVNRLVIPVGQPVHFRLTSATVMNSFLVPQLGSQIYTMPGMATQLNLLAERPGHYRGMSAQISGDGFSDMRFFADAMRPDEYARWLRETRAGGPPLDAAAYALLATPGSVAAPRTYASVSPGLFDTVLCGRACPTMHHAGDH